MLALKTTLLFARHSYVNKFGQMQELTNDYYSDIKLM